MSKPSATATLEQVIARYVEAMEAGRPLDKGQLLQDYAYLQPELGEFLEGDEHFTATARAVRDQLNTPNADSPSAIATTMHLPSEPTGVSSSLAMSPSMQFGDYTIEREIDRGGMGIVYKALHIHLGRTVALKLIRSGELASEEEIFRFRTEAEAAAALTHPGIVPIYEVGRINDLVFYTMAFIDGRSLAEISADGVMEPTEAMRIAHRLCLAMEYAHQNGVVHRDLKPANILIDNKSGQPIIIDFGLAKQANRDSALTVTGQILGTPAYMAPEQAMGRSDGGPASDVYSLGAILYSMCAGQPPFNGPTPFDVLLQVLDRDPPNPSKLNRAVSRELDYICRKALAKEPADRYPSAAAMASDLQHVLRGEPLDYPTTTLAERLDSWWRREPILVAHVWGIGVTTAIVTLAYFLRAVPSSLFPYRLALLLLWLFASYVLQNIVVRAKWRDRACLSWATVDVILYTSLIAFADPPKELLLIGYPMLIVASSLFYRIRFVIFMTCLCTIGFVCLMFMPADRHWRIDFCAIFLSGMVVICMTLLATIRRIRGMTRLIDVIQ